MAQISSLIAIEDPVLRAVTANDLLWNGAPGPKDLGTVRDLRTARGQAIIEAIGAGRGREEIADRLHVRPSDLAWMTSDREPTYPTR
ncbi:hypothetical protein I6A84_43375 [Frankia sp. CNm7]|uniref:Uncharacterized protein n=1 Tax=Frankia nepalensis TaxID=1836974 RepID=A0A937RLE1_9ACTN|nr:hypothetical protein [Frankia nepalensis]MBL7515596.1 hypothetical protein [Frankia nepalensis]MBL7524707.1 hypothetical protein [Frankia nepalensis]MBL7632405.1 hypothetical protein [Frankia nepalensis]